MIHRSLSQAESENGPATEYQFFEPVVCVSELVNWQYEVPEFQMSIKWLPGVDKLLNLYFLVFRSSKKDDPCNELFL